MAKTRRVPSWNAIAIREVSACSGCMGSPGYYELKKDLAAAGSNLRALFRIGRAEGWLSDTVPGLLKIDRYPRLHLIRDSEPPHATGCTGAVRERLLIDVPADQCPTCDRWVQRFVDLTSRGERFLGIPENIYVHVVTESGILRPVPDKNIRVLRYAERGRREEPIGRETRQFSNRYSNIPSTETIRVAHTDTFSLTLSYEKTTSVANNAGVNVYGLELQAKAENQVRQGYQITRTSQDTREQTTMIEVPPSADIEVTIEWRRIVAYGEVIMGVVDKGRSVPLASIPYEINAGLTFDKSMRRV